MEGRPSKEISSAEAVFVGVLSPGVNVRTFLLMVLDYCNNSMLSGFHLNSTLTVSIFTSILYSLLCNVDLLALIFNLILSILMPCVVWH